MRWLTIPQAAVKMGVSERQTRRRLLALQAQNPSRELLRTYTAPGVGIRRNGPYKVNPAVMEELIHKENDATIDELCDRVGSLETYQRIIKHRLARLEKAVFSGKHAEEAEDLRQRLRTLADISGRE